MKQPEGYTQAGKEELVCKLNKSLYGLKQAPRCWNLNLDEFLTSKLGFKKSLKDEAIYLKGKDKEQVIIAVYVDDLLIMSQSDPKIQEVKKALNKNYEMQDLGLASTVLGIKISYNLEAGVLTLSQERYAEEVLKRFNMENCKPLPTPMSPGTKFTKEMSPRCDEEEEQMRDVPYRSAIGSLMYLMVCTRPDLAHSIGVLSRYLEKPGKQHWEGVKRILRYLKGTKDYALRFQRGENQSQFLGYTDSDYAGCHDTSRSTSGYLFKYGGAAIIWSSKRQQRVTLSTCEAEYYAANEAAKEVLWLNEFIEELGFQNLKPIKILCDSTSALALIKNPVHHGRTKQIKRDQHFIREIVEQGECSFNFVPTSQQVADYLTKAVEKKKVEYCVEKCGLSSLARQSA
jgi:hypothetical protein